MWSHELVGTVTGDRIHAVELSSNSWAMRMNGHIGSGESTVETRDPMYAAFSPAFWMEHTRPWHRTLVGKYLGGPVWAHVITSRSYNPLTGTLKLQHEEIGALVKKRLFFPASSYSKNASLSFSNYTREGMLTAVARHACGGGYWADVSPLRLPVHFSTGQSGSWSKTTLQHEFEHPWDWMTDIADGEPGVDFVFSPGFGTDSTAAGEISGFQWVFHTGNPLDRSTHEYFLGVPESPVLSAEVTWDAVDHATAVFALGEGQGSARPVGRYATAGTPEIPRVISLGQESNASSLVSAAQGELTVVRESPEVWSIQLHADRVLAAMHGGPRDGLRPGSRLVLWVHNDPVLGTVRREFYVIGITGDNSPTVTVEGQLL